MKAALLPLTALILLSPLSAQASAMPEERDTGAECQPHADGEWGRFQAGSLAARECALKKIRAAVRPQSTSSASTAEGWDEAVEAAGQQFTKVATAVETLQGYYAQRARRQQVFMDIQSGMVMAFGLGAAAAGGTPPQTQRLWAYATFAPVVNSQVNANEPTGNLYHGGALALELISGRYAKLAELRRLLATPRTIDGCGTATWKSLTDQTASIRAWGTSGSSSGADRTNPTDTELTAMRDDRTAMLADAERLVATCDLLISAEAREREFLAALNAAMISLPAAFADDVLLLDQALLQRDRRLRYSPSEMIGAIIVSPLRTLDSILTGQSAETAMNTLKTQAAFSGLDHALAPIRLPAPPPSTAPVSGLSAETRGRSSASGRSLDQAGKFSEALTAFQAHRRDLASSMTETNYRAALMAEIAAVVQADTLRFHYDPAAGSVDITLGAEPRSSPSAGPQKTDPVSPLINGGP